VVGPDGTKTVQEGSPAADPKIDCFYVYPTVSAQPTPNADLTIDPAEVSVAVAQAARYSQVCRVFAPMYRQVTVAGLLGLRSAAGGKIAFGDVLSAWKDYLARYNEGRGVVLIGHSQGSFILRQLISKYIEPSPSVRGRIVSAILLGGNVIVPAGKDVGGDFKFLGACHSASQTGCVIAFSSFDHTPPPNSLFGRARKPGEQVLCTNPAALDAGSRALDPYLPAHRQTFPFSFTVPPLAATPWVSYPDLFTAQCENVGGASWLQVTDVRKPGDTRPKLRDALGPTWGLHVYDGNIALGNLVDIVRSEATAYHPSG
jgi:pimeloyl-ACP methyl ester carboxylesterase